MSFNILSKFSICIRGQRYELSIIANLTYKSYLHPHSQTQNSSSSHWIGMVSPTAVALSGAQNGHWANSEPAKATSTSLFTALPVRQESVLTTSSKSNPVTGDCRLYLIYLLLKYTVYFIPGLMRWLSLCVSTGEKRFFRT